MRGIIIIAIWGVFPSWAQTWRVVQHPDHSKKAIVAQDKVISDYVYTEVSELSEGKAFVSQGSLYAYIDAQGNALTPYQFTVASNFKHGYALVGDSFSMSVLNDSMRIVVPLQYPRVKLPSSDLIAVQSKEGYWGVYDVYGNLRLPCIFDLPPRIVNKDIIVVRQNELYGVVNDCHEYRFSCAYQYITPDGFGYKRGKYVRLF